MVLGKSLTTLGLCLFLFKMGLVVTPTSQAYYEEKEGNAFENTVNLPPTKYQLAHLSILDICKSFEESV